MVVEEMMGRKGNQKGCGEIIICAPLILVRFPSSEAVFVIEYHKQSAVSHNPNGYRSSLDKAEEPGTNKSVSDYVFVAGKRRWMMGYREVGRPSSVNGAPTLTRV